LLLLLLLIAHVLVLRARVVMKRVRSAQFLWFLFEEASFPLKRRDFAI
jgi:hypothetical protein